MNIKECIKDMKEKTEDNKEDRGQRDMKEDKDIEGKREQEIIKGVIDKMELKMVQIGRNRANYSINMKEELEEGEEEREEDIRMRNNKSKDKSLIFQVQKKKNLSKLNNPVILTQSNRNKFLNPSYAQSINSLWKTL